VQWFSFAAVGLFGTVYVVLRDRRTGSTAAGRP